MLEVVTINRIINPAVTFTKYPRWAVVPYGVRMTLNGGYYHPPVLRYNIRAYRALTRRCHYSKLFKIPTITAKRELASPRLTDKDAESRSSEMTLLRSYSLLGTELGLEPGVGQTLSPGCRARPFPPTDSAPRACLHPMHACDPCHVGSSCADPSGTPHGH